MVGATEGPPAPRPATRADVPALGVLHRALDRYWWGDWVVCAPAGTDPAGDGTPGPG